MATERPFTWDELTQIVEKKEIDTLGRLPQDLQVYLEAMARIQEEYHKIDDYVLHTVFGADLEVHPVSGKKTAKPLNGEKRIVFRLNDYPYALADSIEHHIIWSTYKLSEEEITAALQTYRSGMEVLWFENSNKKKSVKDVHHVHVLSRKKNDNF